MRSAIFLAFGLWVGTLSAAVAQTRLPVLVELFTAQGCSSCPPADALLGELAKREGVIALSLHVDYWDYLGWPDVFANPAFTERQKRYARAHGARAVFTPHFIIGGIDTVEGMRKRQIDMLLRRHSTLPAPIDLRVSRQGTQVTIEAAFVAGAQPTTGTELREVNVVQYLPKAQARIGAGENHGKELAYQNVVTSWQPLATWAGNAPYSATTTIATDQPLVVFIQEAGMGRVLAASLQ